MGIRSVGESRFANLRAVRKAFSDPETWYLRIPSLSMCENAVTLSQISLNSELETIKRLNEAAGRHKLKTPDHHHD
jgi:predicted amino acid racemase